MSCLAEDQLDYILLVYGLAFILLGAVAMVVHHSRRSSLPWNWLGAFGIVRGLAEWLQLGTPALPGAPLYALLCTAMTAGSFMIFAEFARLSWNETARWQIGRWVLIPVLLATFASGVGGLQSLDAAVRLVLAPLAGVVGCTALIRASRRRVGTRARTLVIVGLLLGLYGTTACLASPRAGFWPACVVNREAFLAWTGFPIELPRVFLVLGAAVGCWRHLIPLQKSGVEIAPGTFGRRRLVLLGGMLALVLFLGWLWAEDARGHVEADIRQSLAFRAATAGEIDLGLIRRLTGDAADARRSDYQSLRAQLMRIRAAGTGIRFTYLMGYRGGQVFCSENAVTRPRLRRW